MYHSRRKTQDSPSSFSHSNHHGPVVDFVQVVCRLKLGLYLLPENWAPVESKYQKLIRTIHVLLTLAMFRKMSPHSSSRKSGWSVIFSMGFSQSGQRLQIFVWQRFSHNFIISEQRGPPSWLSIEFQNPYSKLFTIYSDRHWKSQLEVKMCSLINLRSRERINDQTRKTPRKSSVLLILSKRKSALK